MRVIDTTDKRRTAESLLEVEREDVPELISRLAKEKRLSTTVRNLHRELGMRALRHLGFSDV